jgi:SAM-dependent methyltransferase
VAVDEGDHVPSDPWTSAHPYEHFMGRWSRGLAHEVMDRLPPPRGQRWLDVGCGTGAVSEAVVALADPRSLIGIDPSEAYVAEARARITDPRAQFRVGDATHLPVLDASADEVVSGLVLNFVAEPVEALIEMRRALTTGGHVTAYVWDYRDGMQMLRRFWDAAVAEDPSAAVLDEGVRFPLCREGGLANCFEGAGLVGLSEGSVEIPTHFESFDDYWSPLLGRQCPAPSYIASLTDDGRKALRQRLQTTLPTRPDGSIFLTARAWVCQGTAP